MATVNIGDRQVELDDEGHLVRPEDWREDVAREIAVRAGLDGLTEDHWRVIRFVRGQYLDGERPPSCRVVSRRCGITPRQLYRLFPARRPLQLVATVAGVPEPHEYIGGCGVNWWSPWR